MSGEWQKFVLRHFYELPAMIPLVASGILESQSVWCVTLEA